MRQILQELGTGRTILAEVPAPGAPPRGVLIRSRRSLISAGTERMLVEFGRAGWLEKARQQPEKVQQVLAKMRTDGISATLEAVRSKLDQAVPLGYCNVGVVLESNDAPGLAPGDRVVSNGPHAELVAVSRNLCARIPDEVSDDTAAFTVLGSIGLQGLRLAAPTLGETFVVTGLGLIGLMTVQLLRANGCRVLGIDPDPKKTELARSFGALTVELSRGEDPVAIADLVTHGRGADGVLITAATRSDEPMAQAARMCRKRGRIVLVGVAGLQLNRTDFYEKELSFQVSCSYGPGRYDPQYEQAGQDYPLPFVRWTEQRNFETVLEMMARGALDVGPLISHRFAVAEAAQAYDLLAAESHHYLGILLEYPLPAEHSSARERTITLLPEANSVPGREPVLGVIGAGNYASRVLIPAFARAGARLLTIASNGGTTAGQVGRTAGFSTATTDVAAMLDDPRINTVVIATRHDTHARLVEQALAAGKHVFVEKPLAVSALEVDALEARLQRTAPRGNSLLMVGFNRRFAPHIRRMKELLESVAGPKTFVITVNAGAIPATHWTQAAEIGGGRIIGEGCHFIDLMRFLAGAPVERWEVVSLGGTGSVVRDDKASISLAFADGSIGTLHYFANGHPSFPKERIEVFCSGRILQLDNFRRLRGYGWKQFSSMNLWRQDKGQAACVAAFVSAVRGGTECPIPLQEILEIARVTVAIGTAART
jgi:predicted dehydrogenase/threonine dehydrogenase-like Zn-dependent dehydrogenase